MSNDTRRIIVKKVTAGIPTFGVFSINNVLGSLNLLDSSDILITVDSSAGTFTFENTSTLDTVTGRGDSTSNSVTFGDITTTGRINGPSTMILDPNGDNAITGELRVLGDLRVDGTTTSVNSTEVSFNDKNIVLGDSASLASDLNGAGLTIGNDALFGGPAPLFTYNYTNNRFELNRALFVSDDITADAISITVFNADSATFGRIKGEIHGSYIDSNSVENNRLVNSTVTFTDGVDSQVVDLGETVTFNGGTDLTATVSDTNTVTFSHDPSGVTAGTYGSVSEIPVFTVDSQGHVDSVANVSISTTLSLVSDSDSGSVSLLDSSMSINEGEGIDISLSGTTFTVSAEDATITNKGIASFDSGDFEVSSGQVSIKTAGVGNSQLENDTVTIGSTGIALGDSSDTLSGLTQVTTTNLNVTDSATIANITRTGTTVTAGTYGSVTEIPVFTVDSSGFVDSIGEVSISTTLNTSGETGTGSVSLLDSALNIAAGEGINTEASGNTITVSGKDASITNKGVAHFDSGDFTVSSGYVSVKTSGIDNDQLAGGITNDKLVNTTITLGSTTVTLGDSSNNLTIDSADITKLDVTGTATLASASVTDLTNDRIVIAGVSGELEDDSNFTFNGTQFDIGGGNFTVQQASGNTQVVGTLDVDQQTTLASVNVEDLTNDRLVVAGTNGELEDDANLTYDGSTLTVANSTASTSSANGALVVTGGVGIGGALNVGGNLEILGDFTVSGTTTTVDVQTLSVSDPLIHLADSNDTADEVDIGFVAHYYDAALGGKQHTGLFRDADDDKYYLFAQYQDSALDSSPRSNVIDRENGTFVLADLNAATVFADTFSGTVSADSITTTNFTATTVDINGGTIDGTSIGHTTPDSGTFTNLTSTNNTTNGQLFVNYSSTSNPAILVTSTDGNSQASPELELYKNSTSSNGHYLGQLKFTGENSTGGKKTYAKITGKILDNTNGSEDGIIEVAFQKAGSNNIAARFRSDRLDLINGTALNVNGDIYTDSDLSANNITRRNTTVTAGEYGSVTEIPVITVDASGFIDSIGEVTIQDASTSNKGIASFDASDFVVTSGAVSLATDITIDSNLQVNTLTVVDSATITHLTVDGNAQVDGTITASSSTGSATLTLKGSGTTAGDETVITENNGTLTVQGDAFTNFRTNTFQLLSSGGTIGLYASPANNTFRWKNNDIWHDGNANAKIDSHLAAGFTVGGDITFSDSDDIIMPDNSRIKLGDAGDLQIYHDGLHSYIVDNGTGSMMVDASSFRLRNTSGTNILYSSGTGITLYHGTEKLATTSTGVDVTGTVTADQYNNDEAMPTSNPSLSLDFGNSVQIDPRINFSRASIGTYFDGQYIRTAGPDEPRIEYAADGTVKGLLIEEQRTNLVQYSDLSSGWNEVRSSINTNVANEVSPDGTNNVTAITSDLTAANSHKASLIAGNPLSSTGAFTFSAFVKNNGTNVQFDVTVDPANTTQKREVFVLFDLQNVTAATPYTSGSPNVIDYDIEDVGGGWYRCHVTTDNPDGTRVDVAFALSQFSVSNVNPGFNGDGTSGIYVYGAQFEVGSFPTSYIPTNGTEVTREPDIAYMPVSEFNYNQSAGTVVVDVNSIKAGVSQRVLSINNSANSVNDRIDLLNNANSENVQNYTLDGGSLQADHSVSVVGLTSFTVAAAFAPDDYSMCVNGSTVVAETDGTPTVPTVDTFRLGGGVSSPLNGHIRSLKYWPQRLSDATLQAVTQG